MAALVIASACFAGNDAVVKSMAQVMPLGEVLFLRGLIACSLIASVMLASGYGSHLRFAFTPTVLARAGLEGFSAFLFTAALVQMPLAELSSTIMLAPLIITAISAAFLGETVGWRRWTAILIGFCGAILVVKPTPSAFDAWAILGIICAFSSASRDLVTRRIPAIVQSVVVTLVSASAVILLGAILGVAETWRMPTGRESAVLALGAAFLGTANFFVILAFRDVDVSAVSPFRYTLLFWAGLAGYLVFGEVPDAWAAAGALLIVASGLYALHREAVRAREARAVAAAMPLAGST
jgi:drug/metabolite transporter (DMT)-like permease